nr:hypothetical protein [Tanacetum cinerariifolium]
TGFSRDVTPLFDNMLIQAPEEVGILQADAQSIPITTEPSTSKSQKKHKPKRKHTQESEVPPTESVIEQNLPLPSNDPLPSGEDSLKLKELMDLCTNLSKKVLELESEVIDIKSTYQERIEKLEGMIERKVLSMMDVNEKEPTGVEEVLEVVKVAKLMTEVVTTTGATKVSVLRNRRGVIIQDPEETTTTATMQPKVQAKDKGKAILIKEPKPLKRQAQIKLDEEVVRQLEAELNADINWNDVIEQVKRNERLNDAVMKYQTLKRKPLTQALSRRNMIVYLKNMMEEESKELKKHLQIVTDDDDDVYIDATPLASKIPIVDCKIYTERNRPYFKIIRADGNHMLFITLSTMLKNFDREDLESLWKIMRDRFEKTKPKNYSDDYLLNTLKIMFEKPNVEASMWKDQKGKYGLAKEQMLNDIRLQVEDESEMSLELLRLVRRQLNEVQIADKCKADLGYNVVPPLYTRNFLPPKPNLSSLEEFENEPKISEPRVKKTIVETSGAKASKDKPKVVRNNCSPLLIEDWISDSEDEAESKPKIEKKTVKPSFAKIEFVKSKEQVKSPRKKTVKQSNQNSQLEGMSNHYRIYVTPSHTKKIFGNMKRVRKDFSRRVTPLFPTMMVQAQKEMGKESAAYEVVNEEMDDRLVRAATIASGLEAEQDSGNIAKTQSKATPNESSSQGTDSRGSPRFQEAMGDIVAQTSAATTTIIIDDITLAKALEDLKTSKPKIKGIVIKDHKEPKRMQAKEQQELNEEEKAKFFMELLEKRRKFFAAKRTKEKRNRPPTIAQQRSLIERINNFIDFRTKLVKESSKKAQSEITQEESSKTARDELEQESSKKHKIDDDTDTAELKQLVNIISDEEGVAIDAIPLAVKPPSIVDWKIIKESSKKSYC